MANENLAFVAQHKSEIKVLYITDGKTNAKKTVAHIRRKGEMTPWAIGEGVTDNDAIEAALLDARAKGGPPERAETNEKISALSAENAALAKKIEELTKKAEAAAKTAESVSAKATTSRTSQ